MPSTEKNIVGLIGASSPGGVSQGNIEQWFLVIRFAAWRYPGSPVTESELCLEMRVSRTQLDDYRAVLKPYQIIEVAVRGDDHPRPNRITWIKHTGVRDPELTAIAERLQMPVEFKHPVFGKLVYDRRYDWYEAHPQWGDQTVNLYLECAKPDQPGQALETAEVLFREQADWEQRLSKYAVEQLLEGVNDFSLEEGEELITSAEFISRITLVSISTYEDYDEFVFHYDDGYLFGGHNIQIGGNLTEGLKFAGL